MTVLTLVDLYTCINPIVNLPHLLPYSGMFNWQLSSTPTVLSVYTIIWLIRYM